MGQFKPMVKMMTTEPSVELKLKKGGSATHKRMHAEGAKEGFKPVKKMVGGMMGKGVGPNDGQINTAALTRVKPTPTQARAMNAFKKQTLANRPGPGTAGPGPMMPKADDRAPPRGQIGGMTVPRQTVTTPSQMPVMPRGGLNPTMMRKKGGGVEAKLKKHESMPASKAHMGLKTGGIAKSTAPGGYKTGGVVNGQGGFKKGGSVPANGIIKTMTNKTTKVVGAKPDTNSAPTGDVKMGNAGGYKKGGAAKKHFATGGAVDSGRAVAMPKKAPSKPVAISELSGTFKKGGRVC